MGRRNIGLGLALVALLCATNAFAQTAANPLLAIDQHRTTVVERVVGEWGDKLSATAAGVNREQLREMLFAMRADQLLAASLAGSLTGLRDVLAHSLTTAATHKPNMQQVKALGDSADDVVYTPVTPCRLVETRGTFAAVYQGGGAFVGGDIRNYTAQGGNGVCVTQLPVGLNPSALQLQVFGIPINSGSNGDVEILPQGATFGSTATLVYLGNNLFTSASTTARLNLANNQIGVQVRGGGADVAIDVVGYFGAPVGTGGQYFKQGGNTFGAIAKLGTLDNRIVDLYANNQPVARFEPTSLNAPNVALGFSIHGLGSGTVGAIVAGGAPGDPFTAVPGFPGPGIPPFCTLTFGCLNAVTDSYGTVSGGVGNIAGDADEFSSAFDNAFATVGGGMNNWARSYSSTIGGGEDNRTKGAGATVGGGSRNHADGALSTVPGGQSNSALGHYSFAAGLDATIPASAPGSFLWSDTTGPATLPEGAHDQFIVASTNGIGMYTTKTFGVGSHGCSLTGAATMWVCTSDRDAKENFIQLDAPDVLRRVSTMSITRWNEKGVPGIEHIGPVAQDFHAAFGLGADDLHIGSGDLSGVALVAIQGLHQELMKRDALIAKQGNEIAELRHMLLEMRNAMEIKAVMH